MPHSKLGHSCPNQICEHGHDLLVGSVGIGLGDILKPDLVLPLIENLPIEQLASHLPEVCIATMMLPWLPVELILAAQFSGTCSIPGLMDSQVISLSFSKALIRVNIRCIHPC